MACAAGVYDCFSNRLFFISPVPALGKHCSVAFILVLHSLEFNDFELGSKEEWSADLLSCRTFCGIVVTKDVMQLPVGKSEGPFIYLKISRAYTG